MVVSRYVVKIGTELTTMVTLEPNRKLSPHYLPSIHPTIHPGVLEGAGSFRLSSWGLGEAGSLLLHFYFWWGGGPLEGIGAAFARGGVLYTIVSTRAALAHIPRIIT